MKVVLKVFFLSSVKLFTSGIWNNWRWHLFILRSLNVYLVFMYHPVRMAQNFLLMSSRMLLKWTSSNNVSNILLGVNVRFFVQMVSFFCKYEISVFYRHIFSFFGVIKNRHNVINMSKICFFVRGFGRILNCICYSGKKENFLYAFS